MEESDTNQENTTSVEETTVTDSQETVITASDETVITASEQTVLTASNNNPEGKEILYNMYQSLLSFLSEVFSW